MNAIDNIELPPGCLPAVDTRQAAAMTGLSPATLETYRCRGGGPRFVRYGHGGRGAVRYRVDELLSWMEKRTVASTSEGGVA